VNLPLLFAVDLREMLDDNNLKVNRTYYPNLDTGNLGRPRFQCRNTVVLRNPRKLWIAVG
jgi:hypothetical protein